MDILKESVLFVSRRTLWVVTLLGVVTACRHIGCHVSSSTTQRANALLRDAGVNDTRARLAVMVLHTEPQMRPGLSCAIRRLCDSATGTGFDFFLWVRPENVQNSPFTTLQQTGRCNVFLFPVENANVRLPHDVRPAEEWFPTGLYGEDYRMLGRWRLTFALRFPVALGYQFMAHLDTDLFVNSTSDENLVSSFRANDTVLAPGYENPFFRDNPDVQRGMPELVRYWLTTRAHLYENSLPKGPLFQHCSPQSIDGLSTAGWDQEVFWGNLVYFDAIWWTHEPLLIDFLELILLTNADIEWRWSEQGVNSMMRLLFIPAERFQVRHTVVAIHDKGYSC